MAEERRKIFELRGLSRTQHTDATLRTCQNRWNDSSNGRWTYSLIGNLETLGKKEARRHRTPLNAGS